MTRFKKFVQTVATKHKTAQEKQYNWKPATDLTDAHIKNTLTDFGMH